jgi:hypothetical protein
MKGKDHARIHSGRTDSNRRPRGSTLRTALDPEASTAKKVACAYCGEPAPYQTATCVRCAQTEARYQGLDGLHPDEA